MESSRTLEYMLRLEPEDFRDAAWVERLAEGRQPQQRSAARALRAPDRVIGEPLAMKRIGIVVGGGPAPGTNAVIAAAVIEAVKLGCIPTGHTRLPPDVRPRRDTPPADVRA